MIRIEVEEYCDYCMNFSPDVTKPTKVFSDNNGVILSDTVVRCEYRKRCDAIKKYLQRQLKEEAVG